MSDYGFVINVSGNSVNQMKQIEDAVKKLGGSVKSATNEIGQGFRGLAESAGELQRHLIQAFSVYEIYNFGKELLHLTAEFQGFENVIKYSSLGVVDNARNIDFLNDAITRLKLPMKDSYQSFSEMQAGMVGTGIEGAKLRRLFEGVATAASVMHLNPESFSRTTFALKEIGELGTLQARQLRMLSFALPGSGQLAASAMGMSMEKLHEQMRKGAINSSEFLPKFSEALIKDFAPGLALAGKSLISQMNVAQNDILKTMLDMGTALMPLWLDILSTISSAMKEIKGLWNGLTGNTNFVNFLKTIFDWAVKLIPIWATYKAIMLATSLVTSVLSIKNGILTASMGELTFMTDGATVAFEGLDAAIASTGIGALAIGIGLVVGHLIRMNQQLDDAIDKKYKLTESNDEFKSISGQATSLKEQWGIFNQMGKVSKAKFAADIGEFLSDTRNKIPLINQRNSTLQKAAATLPHPSATQLFIAKYNPTTMPLAAKYHVIETADKTHKAADEMSANVKALAGNFDWAKEIGAQLKKQGLKLGYSTSIDGNSGKDLAINTANLAGASGGLGQAKIIKISFNGPFQQNNGVRESKDQADEAIQKMIEIINGFDQSQNAQ